MQKNITEDLIRLSDVEGIFFIPAYQRGYRWTASQIRNLLDDFQDFMENGARGIFFLQSLVVSSRPDIDNRPAYELIDGQQRLTTLSIFEAVLRQKCGLTVSQLHFDLIYESRPESADFIRRLKGNDAIDPAEADVAVDFYHMLEAKKTMAEWVNAHAANNPLNVIGDLGRYVTFLWHDTSQERYTSPEQRFTRINSGKIPLTDAELCRSLLLMPDYHDLQDDLPADLRQVVDDARAMTKLEKKALEKRQILMGNGWDRMERALHNEEFWAFLGARGDFSTRMDFLLRLLYLDEGKPLAVNYPCFENLYDRLKSGDYNAGSVWNELRNALERLEYWYENNDYYHKIGYLNTVSGAETLAKLLRFANSHTEKETRDEINSLIRDTFPGQKMPDLDNFGYGATLLRRLLFLANVEFARTRAHRYARFPFDMKIDKNDIEHIDAKNVKDISTKPDMLRWLEMHEEYLKKFTYGDYMNLFGEDRESSVDGKLVSKDYFSLKQTLLEKGTELLTRLSAPKTSPDEVQREFQEWEKKFMALVKPDMENDERLESDGAEKNNIYNLALLDPSVNRSLNNAIFAVKQKQMADILANGASYIPPMTQALFMRHFNNENRSAPRWTDEDRTGYRKLLRQLLSEYWNELRIETTEANDE